MAYLSYFSVLKTVFFFIEGEGSSPTVLQGPEVSVLRSARHYCWRGESRGIKVTPDVFRGHVVLGIEFRASTHQIPNQIASPFHYKVFLVLLGRKTVVKFNIRALTIPGRLISPGPENGPGTFF